MKNVYLLVKPSEFIRYDGLDIDGNYPGAALNDFEVEEELNYLMFEASCETPEEGKIRFPETIKELFTGKKFDLEIKKNPNTDKKEVMIKSDELGLYQNSPLELNQVRQKASKIAGMLKYIKGNKRLTVGYMTSLDSNFKEAIKNKKLHDMTVNGPQKSDINSILKTTKKIR